MRLKILALGLLAGTMFCSPLAAQSNATGPLDQRVNKLEKEMKAVQRSVFPGGTPVEPDIVGNTGPAEPTGNPASTPLADLTARIDALEKGLASLTGEVEQTGYRGRQADEAIKRLEARIVTLEGGGAPAGAPAPDGGSVAPPPS